MSFDPNDPETKAALKAAAKEAAEEAVEPLAAKNKQLLGELKEARKGREIDPAELEKLESQIHDLETELRNSQKAAKKAEGIAEKATQELSDATEKARSLTIKNGLTAQLTKAGVAPHFMDATLAMHSSKVSVNDEGEAMVGDKSVEDFVTEWSQSDEGKHYIVAPNNGGGGGPGGSKDAGGAKTIKRSEFDQKSPAEKSAFVKEGGTLTD